MYLPDYLSKRRRTLLQMSVAIFLIEMYHNFLYFFFYQDKKKQFFCILRIKKSLIRVFSVFIDS